jgi:hypothetical protein
MKKIFIILFSLISVLGYSQSVYPKVYGVSRNDSTGGSGGNYFATPYYVATHGGGGGISTVYTTSPILGDGSSGNHVRADTGYHNGGLLPWSKHVQDSISITLKVDKVTNKGLSTNDLTSQLIDTIRQKVKQIVPTTVKTATYTAQPYDFVPCDNTTASDTVILPSNPDDKTRIGVKIINGSHTTTLKCSGSDVFNKTSGSTAFVLQLVNQSAILQYQKSTNIWYVISTDAPYNAMLADTANTIKNGSMSKYDYFWLQFNIPANVAYTTVIPLNKSHTIITGKTLTSNDALSVASGAIEGGQAEIQLTGDGAHSPVWPSGSVVVGVYDINAVNIIYFAYVNATLKITIVQGVIQ